MKFIASAAVGLLLFSPSLSRAQATFGGAREAALAGSGSAIGGDVWSESNPAGWSEVGGFAAAVHAGQLYGLEELRLGAAQVVVSTSAAVFVGGIRTFGFNAFRESTITFGAARSIRFGTHRPLYVGVRIRRHHMSFAGYGSAAAGGFSAGLILPVNYHLRLGMSAENLLAFGGPFADELPRRIHMGLSASMGAFGFTAATSKDVRSPVSTSVGIEARPVPAFAVRAGYTLSPAGFSGGAGIRMAPLTIDLAAERHLILGWTPSCSVALQW